MVALVVTTLLWGWRRFDASRIDIRYGAIAVWVLLAVITGIWAPGAGYLFIWPALAGTAALAWTSLTASNEVSLAGFAGVAAIAVWLMTPAVDLFFHFAHPPRGTPVRRCSMSWVCR